MSKLILILGILVVAIILGGYFFMTSSKLQSYKSQAECESATGKECMFSSCDYKCENSEYGYFKGYIPVN